MADDFVRASQLPAVIGAAMRELRTLAPAELGAVTLRMGTVLAVDSEGKHSSVQLDGEVGSDAAAAETIGPDPKVGDRVLVLFSPPSGAYAIGTGLGATAADTNDSGVGAGATEVDYWIQTVAESATDAATFTYSSGSVLLDLSDPTNPLVLAGGTYTVDITVRVPDTIAGGGFYRVSWDPAAADLFQANDDSTPGGFNQDLVLSVTVVLNAGDALGPFYLANHGGAGATDLEVWARVTRLAQGTTIIEIPGGEGGPCGCCQQFWGADSGTISSGTGAWDIGDGSIADYTDTWVPTGLGCSLMTGGAGGFTAIADGMYTFTVFTQISAGAPVSQDGGTTPVVAQLFLGPTWFPFMATSDRFDLRTDGAFDTYLSTPSITVPMHAGDIVDGLIALGGFNFGELIITNWIAVSEHCCGGGGSGGGGVVVFGSVGAVSW